MAIKLNGGWAPEEPRATCSIAVNSSDRRERMCRQR